MIRLATLALTLLALPFSTPASAQEETFPELGLTIDVAGLPGLEAIEEGKSEQLVGRWIGEVDGVAVDLRLFALAQESFEFEDPWEVIRLVEQDNNRRIEAANKKNPDDQQPPFVYEETRPLPGAFGYISYAWLGVDVQKKETKPVATYYCLGGIVPKFGYSVEMTCTPALNDTNREKFEAFFTKGISYAGEVREPRWTDEEVDERWQESAPDKVFEKSKLMVVRTKHYLIMTNLGKGTARGFGKKIDEAFEEIQEVFPFEEVEGSRLMPIFYFPTPQQYHEWYVKNLGATMKQAERSGGVATGDLYATYHQATNAPVHIHEATHQIFRNRLRLPGGGSWYQEAAAEYMSTEPNGLSHFKGIAKRRNHTPLREFVTIKSLLQSADPNAKSGNEAGSNYDQAAAFMEFKRHDKRVKDKFEEFLYTIGRIPRNHTAEIEAAFQSIFGLDLDQLDAEFVRYWEKRKKPKKR